jgi:FkbM family methyltransferase
MMYRRNFFRFFTEAYSVARSANLLQTGWTNRVFVFSYFLYKRLWEDPFGGLIHRQPELFRNGDVLDIGANIGYTACLFARTVGLESKVYSFEPDEATFRLLKEVIQRKKLSEKIIATKMAVGSADGSIEFWHNEKHSGDHRVVTNHFENSHPDSSRTSTVPVISVDSFVESLNLQRISFVKIDVQGYELAVCEGMKQTLSKFPELCVCCEFAPESLIELGFDPVGLLNFFRTNGYQLHVLTRSSILLARDNATIQQVAEEAGYVDLLCSKRVLT